MKHVANVALFVAAVIASSCSHSPPPEPPAKPAPEVKPPEPTPPPADTGSATPTDTGSATPAPPVKPAEDTFIERPKTEKLEIMKTKVMPAMAKAFKAQDGKRFAKFNCKTCHGKGAADESFKMPNPDLPKLDFEALHSGKLEPKVAAMAEFMEKTVEPDVANILGLTKFDPAHRELGGFGCLACHEAKK